MMRSVVLAVSIAVVCGALVCQPNPASASPDYYAFGNTQSPTDYATLILQEGNKSVSLSTDGFQGWIETNSFNFAGPDGNSNYLAGDFNGSAYNNFFVFNLAGVKSPVSSAELVVNGGTISRELDYSLFGGTEAISALVDGVSPNLALYDELASGMKYGSFVLDTGNSMHTMIFALNAAAVGDINKAIAKSTRFALSGSAAPVPEASTWAMMLAGFAGLGFAAYRRSAKGRATVTAG